MGNLLNMQDFCTPNIAVIILCVMMLFSVRKTMHSSNSNYRLITWMIVIIGIYSIIEVSEYMLTGSTLPYATPILFALSSLLYFFNMVLARIFVIFLSSHIGFPLNSKIKTMLIVPIILGSGLLIYNLFDHIAFSYPGNVFYYDSFEVVFSFIAVFYLALGLTIYYLTIRNGGLLKYFPVWMYVIPVVIGMILEALIGSGFISVGNAVGLSAVLSSLQDERIFRDSLTGLYNRSYLEEVKHKLERSSDQILSGVMIDLNGFKNINDTFGHAEGDQALIISAGIIKSGVGIFGDAIRYAGDEFILLINTWDEDLVRNCVKNIEDGFDRFNKEKHKPYHLSASFGYAVFNAESQSVNEFLNTIDKNMYMNKELLYKKRS